ncbi:MAG: PepSY domain-containing protein [Nitrosomonas sp.]|nr:PepSY domain-containing protein [Nitrosomonas sp.]MCW5607382.1 PepSY domain-containing protein [Nitrosomonas sp.]
MSLANVERMEVVKGAAANLYGHSKNIPMETPHLDWREARWQGQAYIRRAAAQYGFTIERKQVLSLDRIHGVHHYRVKTNKDWGKYGATVVTLDADTGAFISLTLPDTDSIGDIAHRWITWLHTARVFGLPIQILICMTRLIVVALSITGTVIWWRKRASGQRQRTSGKHIKAGSSTVIPERD